MNFESLQEVFDIPVQCKLTNCQGAINQDQNTDKPTLTISPCCPNKKYISCSCGKYTKYQIPNAAATILLSENELSI
jgi:hypothetical protein